MKVVFCDNCKQPIPIIKQMIFSNGIKVDEVESLDKKPIHSKVLNTKFHTGDYCSKCAEELSELLDNSLIDFRNEVLK